MLTSLNRTASGLSHAGCTTNGTFYCETTTPEPLQLKNISHSHSLLNLLVRNDPPGNQRLRRGKEHHQTILTNVIDGGGGERPAFH